MQVLLEIVAFSLQNDGSGRPVLTKRKRPKTPNYKLLCIHNWKRFETCFLACFLHLIPSIAFSLFSEVSSTHRRRFAVLNERAIRLFNVSKAEVEKAKRLGLKLLSRHSPKPADQARVQT